MALAMKKQIGVPGAVIRVAINTPVNKLFDYLPPDYAEALKPGMRVRVSFGRQNRIGIIVALADSSEVPANKLKRATELLDTAPVLDQELLSLLTWASDYYQHPPGEVIGAAVPVSLRQGATPKTEPEYEWFVTDAGQSVDLSALTKKASAQATLLGKLLIAHQGAAELRTANSNWRKIIGVLVDKGWVERREVQVIEIDSSGPAEPPPTLTAAQNTAIAAVAAEGFAAHLLEGVTGSGKTEVYLHLIEQQIAAGRQSLVLVPEIGLTPQLLDRFARRLRTKIAVLHSGLTDLQRFNSWLSASENSAKVIIGTRSAIFSPLPRPGLIIVDEEHDASFKQQEGFRYSARDLAVWRGRQLNVPVVLGSATPALESLLNVSAGRYQRLSLPERPGSACQPDVRVIDLRTYPVSDGLSQPLLEALRHHLEAGNQALVYLNRRGFAPTLLCPSCGETQECTRCDARLVLHQARNRLVCHHCGSERPALKECADCHSELIAVGQGTERLEQALRNAFPDYPLVRIDRDTTRKRGELERLLETVRNGTARILLGTQMLTKGHDFPNVTCVGIVDSDQGLFGTDFRSGERLAQSILQVAGRAGRGKKPGEVWLQTYSPEHPLLTTLIQEGYPGFAKRALVEREAAEWPPYTHLALLRSECARREVLYRFLDEARAAAETLADSKVHILGPASAPMEKRSGRFRGQLLIQSPNRGRLQHFLSGWRDAIAQLGDARRTRWSLDVDPLELF